MKSHTIPIFVAINDKYTKFAAVMMTSILFNTKSHIEFYVMHDKTLSNFHKKQLGDYILSKPNVSIEFIEIDTLKTFGDLNMGRYTHNVYSRFLIPILKPSISKALFLDADIAAFDDISLLYDIELDGHGVAAALDFSNKYVQKYLRESLKLKDPLKYFNAGVMIIDCDYWRKNDTTAKLIEMIKMEPLQYHDQDILNLYFENNYKLLDTKFNYRFIPEWIDKDTKRDHKLTDEGIWDGYRNCVLRHWIWENKPDRYDTGASSNFEEFWFFMKMTPYYEGALATYMGTPK